MASKKRIKLEGHELENATVSHISLVSRPANRLPFRITKAEAPDTDQSSEEQPMFNFDIFKSRKAEDEQPTLAAVIVSGEYADAMAQKLEADGFKVDQREDHDAVSVFKQAEYDENDVTGVQLSDHVGVLVRTHKQFDPFPESISFDENIRKAGFMPGVAHATMALEDTVRTVLFKSDDKSAAVEQLGTVLDQFRDYVMKLAGDLPDTAFTVEKAAKAVADESAAAPAEDTAEKEAKTEGEQADGSAENTDETGDEQTEKSGDAEGPKEAMPGDLDEGVKKDEPADAASEKADEQAEKSEETSISEVLAAVKGLKDQISEISEGQEKLTQRVADTEASIEKTQKQVANTVVMGAGDGDDSGEQARKEEEQASGDDDPWSGVPGLDRIASMA